MSDEDYETGYGRPPKHTQFKPGQSGNPKGRPKGAKGWREIIERAGNRRHRLTINGKSVSMSQREIAVEKLYQKAMQGDLKAFQALIAFDDQKPLKGIESEGYPIYDVTLVFEEEQVREMERAEREEAARLAENDADPDYPGTRLLNPPRR